MTDRVAIRRLPTGVPGLDEILGGGLPEFSFNLIAGAPGAGKTTLIAALDTQGICCSTVVDGAVNADVFEAFVEQVLLPTLHRGDVIVMAGEPAVRSSARPSVFLMVSKRYRPPP